MLYEFALWDFEKNCIHKYHVGALLDVNTKGVQDFSQACGFDSIADFNYAESMGIFLNKLEK